MYYMSRVRTMYIESMWSVFIFINIFTMINLIIFFFFFSIRVFFTDTDDSQDSRRRERTIFYSTLPLPPTHEHWHIYLQLCMWDDYHVFLMATLVLTRLLLFTTLSNYHLSDWLMIQCLFVYLMNWY